MHIWQCIAFLSFFVIFCTACLAYFTKLANVRRATSALQKIMCPSYLLEHDWTIDEIYNPISFLYNLGYSTDEVVRLHSIPIHVCEEMHLNVSYRMMSLLLLAALWDFVQTDCNGNKMSFEDSQTYLYNRVRVLIQTVLVINPAILKS